MNNIKKTILTFTISAVALSANNYHDTYSVEVDLVGNPVVKEKPENVYPKTVKEKNGIKIIGDDLDVKTISIKEARKLLRKKNISLDKTHKHITILKNTKDEVVYVAKNLTKSEINLIENLIKSGKQKNIAKVNHIIKTQDKKNNNSFIGNVKEKILMNKKVKEKHIEVVEVDVLAGKSDISLKNSNDAVLDELEKNNEHTKKQKYKLIGTKPKH